MGRLLVITHKPLWRDPKSPSGFATDGGFPAQLKAISELFDQTDLLVPIQPSPGDEWSTPVTGRSLKVGGLGPMPAGRLRRKLWFPVWLMVNLPRIVVAVIRSDAVHAPIPGDVGTIGMLVAFVIRRPLFVRYCGVWGRTGTWAEHFWKWFLERFGGGRNVFLATGECRERPSEKNQAIQWIFSTSLTLADLKQNGRIRELPPQGELRLIVVARLERSKNIDLLIRALPGLRRHRDVRLDIVGDGADRTRLEELAGEVGQGIVTFHGYCRGREVSKFLSQAHLFCFPTQAEGFPKALLEAMAHGLPCVASPVSAIPEMLKGGAGELLSERDVVSVETAVNRCFADPQRYRTMSERALSFAQTRSLEQWKERLHNLLWEAWKNQSAGCPLADSTALNPIGRSV